MTSTPIAVGSIFQYGDVGTVKIVDIASVRVALSDGGRSLIDPFKLTEPTPEAKAKFIEEHTAFLKAEMAKLTAALDLLNLQSN